MMKRLNFNLRLLFGFLLLILTMAFSGYVAYQSLLEYKKSDQWVQHTLEVIHQNDNVLSLFYQTETSYRGFIVTGDSFYINEYSSNNYELKDNVQKLEQLLRDNQLQHARVDSLRKKINQKISWMDFVLAKRKNGFEDAQQAITTGRGKKLNSEIEKKINEIQAHEVKLLSDRREIASANSYSSIKVMLIAFVFFAFFGASLFLYISKSFKRRQETEKKLNTINDDLKKVGQENEHQTWLLQGAERVNAILRKDLSIQESVDQLLNELATYTNAPMAHAYIVHPEKKQISPISSFGSVLSNLKELAYGEGIVGQIALDEAPREFSLPDQRKMIGTQNPMEIQSWYIQPMYAADDLVLIVELGYLQTLSDLTKTYLDIISESIALALRTFTARDVQKELNEQLSVQALELEHKNSELERVNNYRQEFMAQMSHEIRNPINGIVTLLHLLREENLTPEQAHLARVADQSAQTLLGVVNDILDLAKIEAGKLDIQPVTENLKSVVADTAELVSYKAQEKKLQFLVNFDENLPELVEMDALRVKQIILNLLGNAVKFTHQGTVELNVSGVQSSNSFRLKMEFIDSGTGMSEEELKRLFRQFEQFGKSSSGSSGLGLSIVKRLVDLMHGTISVESKINQGTNFTVELPLAISDIQTMKQDVKMPEDILEGIEVLLVEDNLVNQMTFKMIMEKWGVKLDIAGTGKEALEFARSKVYNLMLMDTHLPDIEGFEVSKTIRENVANLNHATPILSVSASVLGDHLQKALSFGMNDAISKPININELRIKMAQYSSGICSLD